VLRQHGGKCGTETPNITDTDLPNPDAINVHTEDAPKGLSGVAQIIANKPANTFAIVLLDRNPEVRILSNLLERVHLVNKKRLTALGPMSAPIDSLILSQKKDIVIMCRAIALHRELTFQLPKDTLYVVVIEKKGNDITQHFCKDRAALYRQLHYRY
jgi:hypothetical protein